MQLKTDSCVLGVASPITDHDVYLFKEGSHFKLHKKLGAHIAAIDGPNGKVGGVHFAVWAPNAQKVSVIGDFNGWDGSRHELKVRDDWSGIWEGFIPGLTHGTFYKYRVESRYLGFKMDKSDPFAFYSECPPMSASIVWSREYRWSDSDWMANRHRHNSLKGPMSIYELHPGSWKRVPEEGNRFLTYREMAVELAGYAKEMGFTHIELLPVMEHPFYGSWGYQTVGYFSPTSRYGTPEDFMFFVDHLHQNGIGVILDWVPSHFPGDGHGLAFFDGTHLFEHADPRKGFHPDWASWIFNYGRNEVRSFLISSALYWLEMFHIDGIRVDAVASMLYLDYSRKEGEWIPNEYGGRENLEAISFLKRFNEAVYAEFPDVQTMAEESTDWPMVSRPTYLGGLGFGIKWNMGWMHDTLKFFSEDPLFRKYHHDSLTFSLWYAFSENFILPLSHDEVVHGKGSLIGKMPGDEWQRHANLRLLYGYMFGHPGKKLLFMGDEFAQVKEWRHDESLEWHVLQYDFHAGAQRWVKDLNRTYRSEPALYELDFESAGFEWIDANNYEDSVISFIRKGHETKEIILVVCNLTPAVRKDFTIGVPEGGLWQEILNSDSSLYGGTNVGNSGGVNADAHVANHRPFSIKIKLPPLACVMFKWGT
ncbi:MAG: 1,4-alpha-glucan branching protein GlgB [Deltaproteobacteria bacterium]|nr:1,4-alpha-glucan branching protein GlgB [Deltaproteobacteria bacterium]